MKKKTFLYVFILLFSFAMNSYTQTGKIWGYVYNGTQDSTLLANIKVEVIAFNVQHGMIVDDSSFVTKTNRAGKFQMTNLKLDTTLLYYPRAEFSNIVYYGHGVRLTKDSPILQSDVVVYDTTRDKSNIAIQMDHIFIEDQNDKIIFREIMLLSNMGKKTFMGTEVTHGEHHHVFEFPLPEKFENVQILSQHSQGSMFVSDNKIIDSALFPPGTRQVSYQFEVPKPGSVWHYSREIHFPTMSANIFISQPHLKVEGPGIVPMGDFPIRNVNYQRYQIQHSMPGTPLEITLSNLSKKSLPIQWIVLGVVAAFLLLGFGYTMLKPAKK